MKNILNILFIAKKSLMSHLLSTVITVISIALATGLVMSVFSVREQAYEAFAGGTFGYDAVLGKGGSELQLVLNTIYHLESSPGNVPWSLYEKFSEEPSVELAVPYALGDSYKDFRIVGTTTDIFNKIGRNSDEGFTLRGRGKLFDPARKQAVIGSYVAQKTDLGIGSRFTPYHGMYSDENTKHEEEFEVVGIVETTNTPHDRVIWIPLEHFFRTEGHVLRGSGAEYTPPENGVIPDRYKEVSAVMLELSEPGAGFKLKQKIDKENIDATLAWPIGTVVADLFGKIGWFRDILGFVSYCVVLVSLGAVLASIYNTIHDRRREFAVMRALGAGKDVIFKTVIVESAAITAAGALFGFVINFMILASASFIIKQKTGILINVFEFQTVHLAVPVVMILSGLLVGVIPAFKAYRTEVAENLNPS